MKTDLARDSRMANALKPLMSAFGRSPEQGADTLVWLATDAEGGKPHAVYYADRKPAKTSARAKDAAGAARLWDVSAELVKL